MRVILLTNDAASRALAESEGVEALHLSAYARERKGQNPQLMDLVARAEMEEDELGEKGGVGVILEGGRGAEGGRGREGGGQNPELMDQVARAEVGEDVLGK